MKVGGKEYASQFAKPGKCQTNIVDSDESGHSQLSHLDVQGLLTRFEMHLADSLIIKLMMFGTPWLTCSAVLLKKWTAVF